MALFAFGSNGSGQLGIGHEEDVNVPTSICIGNDTQELDLPAHIAAGGNHTLVLCSNGDVYASGNNADGRCLVGAASATKHRLARFEKLFAETAPYELFGSFKGCAATWEASIFLTNGFKLLTCGTGEKGELGLGSTCQTTDPRPVEIKEPSEDIIQVDAGMRHVVAVLSNGDAYGWGAGRKGQIGEPNQDCFIPRKITGIPFKVQRAVCGSESTVLVGPPETGELLIIGSDKHSVRSNAPNKIPGWKQVVASWGGVYVLSDAGELVGWGRNDHGQLPPPDLPRLDMIAAGSEHMLVKTEDGKVLAWGWGEHGNCGVPVDDQGDVKGKWNEIPTNGNVISVAAGCATSWICQRQ
ncbi:regulator of chromosome condensation 1/beta-lactamase-inhibitor protein II [Lineolata rhizophorae]|uniref:Regulator of chromosome condensation 1/beta-lactamase-inhibitor protein II n=1 Tax=Lineolata rhizophorae TaxID=578093 RepID=A0A6A6P201_9PEZI|nr:regulator of chromosome condensation 1/beta-lactamase-inhibitor protein II [Lineolata rhizophorae]